MNRDYEPRYKREHAGPYDNEHFDIQDVDTISLEECESLVGRIILQKGLVGALVLSFIPYHDKYNASMTPFKIKLASGDIVGARYRKSYIWIDAPETPAGIAEDGWYVPELGIEYVQHSVPF